jgi:hypothetical protein
MTQVAESGWFNDPVKRHVYRYWDGTHWTDQVSDRGDVTVDPLDTQSAPAAPEVITPLPAPHQTAWIVEYKVDYAMPPLCCVCGQAAPALGRIHVSTRNSTAPGMTTWSMRFPLCDRCEAIRAGVEKNERGGTGFFGFHGTKEQKQRYQRVRLSAQMENAYKGLRITLANPEFAEAFSELNGARQVT